MLDPRGKRLGRALTCASAWLCLLAFGTAQAEHRLDIDDILAVVPSTYDRYNLIRAGRQWRKGLQSFILADRELDAHEKESVRLHRETWGVFADDTHSTLTVGPRSGDLRAAVAPFVANNTMGIGNWKWMLYGDDDTVFFIDNVLETLKQYDWRQPYLLTDCLWWPQNGSGVKLHPNREAPRCLPCNYEDPALMAGNMCPGMTGFMPVQGCPCTPEVVMEGHWPGGQPKFPDGKGIFDRRRGAFVERPDDPNSPNVGWWYMLHGGAGAIISRGAMERASFPEVIRYLNGIERQSGDAMLTKAFWHVLRLAPTDPGYGVCRPGLQMFDPGFAGPRAHGPEDAGTLDAGGDPIGVIQKLEEALSGSGACDEACEDQLLHTLTVHVRSRHVAQDLSERSSNRPVTREDGPPVFRTACHIMRKLPALHRRHATRKRGRDKYVPLWQD